MVEGSDASCIRAATTRRHMAGDGAATYTYNDAGQMISATQAGVTTSYAINALGQRVKKSDGSITTYFVYDEAGHLVGEYDNAGTLVQETIWLDDIPVATIRPNGTGIDLFYIHTDHLNTPRRISRPSDNAVVWRWDSDPFGTSAANEDPDGDTQLFTFNLRFPGQYYDQETGLFYNYFRDGYDSATGRYTQSDPIGLQGGINTYLYANANPISLSDPLGLDAYMCMKPLHALGETGEWFFKKSTPLLYHQYLCVKDGKMAVCGGQDRAGGPYSPGTPSKDSMEAGQCEKKNDRPCVDKCLIKAIQSPTRPKYGLIGPGTNCQEWADDTLAKCVAQCQAK